ncbi:MAG: hypothetical protein ACLQF0_03200 [Dissulfurispiraceae bacterium]
MTILIRQGMVFSLILDRHPACLRGRQPVAPSMASPGLPKPLKYHTLPD